MHHDMKVNAENENKPELIEFYNLTKGGVDCLDQKCAIFSVGRRSRRWPQVLWFGLLNISGVNAHVILNSVDLQTKLDRRNFLKNLGLDLCQPHLKRRSQLSSLPRELGMTVQRIVEARLPPEERPLPAALPPEERPGPAALPQEEPHRPAQNQPPPKRRSCSICPRKRDQKHPTECEKCLQAVCKAHSTVHIMCHDCIDN
ncbi:uncharacterized protein LOC111062071 [Nilaparvata lugens]|uniref:uncharacterized protein LOC111062071 n=1 Tax=Nilaparvata lugens TaxID=108931 RepID=UPI00193D6012|nr:uncharacterized protein LOC111062071 [Nilaparvata lugens]